MFSSPAAESSLFNRLPARPPTPPRDIETDVEDALTFLREGHQSPSTSKTPAQKVSAPTDTPPLRTATAPESRDSAGTKKVDFSPWPTYHKIPQLGQSSSPDTRLQRQTPLKRDTKPLKSILKAAGDRLPPTPDDLKISLFSPEEPGSFRKMMHSVVRQLSSDSRDDRRDAYLALNNTLKTLQSVPEPQAIIDKIDFLQQFLSRDMAWKDSEGRLDSHIVTQALTLTVGLLFHQQLASAFDDDFRAFILDRCISILEQADVSKAIIKNHLHLLAVQRFKPHVMTAGRADKLVTLLRGLEDRCSGNSAIATRLLVYQKLVEQAPATMLSRMRDWIDYVCHGLLSSIAEIRVRAIEACSLAAITLGTQAQAAKVILEIMDRAGEDEQTYGSFFIARLEEMVKDKQTAGIVPQIWSAIILFFRCKRRPIDKWPQFRHWLLVIQRCLNHGDLEVKHRANISWNKLVYAIMPDSATADTMRSMLKVPIVAALDKRGSDKQSQQQKQIAMDSYCNLLHYGLRPGLSYEDVDKAWDLYVDPVLASMAESRSKGQHNVCRIIHGLLKSSNGVWNADAALESVTIKPDELPRLEPRWVRSRLSRVIKALEPIIQTGMWSSPDANRKLDICWRLLLQSISEAGAQEVKTSPELRDAIAQLTNLYRRVWFAESRTERSDAESSVWINRFQQLLQVAVEILGPGHFMEDILSKTSEDEVEAAPTPSHRHLKQASSAYPSIVFLFALHYQPRPEIFASGLYKGSATWLLELLAKNRGSAHGTLCLLYRCLQFSTDLATSTANSDVSPQLWNTIADLAIETLGSLETGTLQSGTQIIAHLLRSALDITTFGLRYAAFSPACLTKANDLYVATCRTAKHYGASGGVSLGVMEPAAKSLVNIMDDMPITVSLGLGEAIATHGTWPESRQDLEKSRKILWTFDTGLHRTSAFEPFEHLYACFRAIFTRTYDQMNQVEIGTEPVEAFLTSVVRFLQRCPKVILSETLRQIQGGVVDWIEDRKRHLFPVSGSGLLPQKPVVAFWSDILKLIESCPQKDSALLQSVEPLLIAGLSSPSRAVVNGTILSWNKTFGEAKDLRYPSRIQPVLRARQSEAHLELPDFPNDENGIGLAAFPAFAESQLAPQADFGSSMPMSLLQSALKKNPPSENIFIKQHLAAQGLPYDTTLSKKPTPRKATTPKARLRHDDSQIDFQPVESPAPTLPNGESQLITEHQREVQARQKGDAQMFPELSSSPAHSTAKTKGVAKKLDFSSDAVQRMGDDGGVSTPTGLQEGNPMSDDLPSSPTPRAAANATLAHVENAEYSDDEETICDPPSSPPRQEDLPAEARRTRPDETTVVLSTFVEDDEVRPANDSGRPTKGGEGFDTFNGSDLPSDTLLPAVQLEREAAAAVAPTQVSSFEIGAAAAAPQGTPRNETNAVHRDPDVQTPSRIQDSMIQHSHEPTETPPSQATTPKNGRTSKKRKRDSDTVRISKKRSKSSPVKNWLANVWKASQEDEDTDDEIVVASSQTRSPRVRDDTPIIPSSQPEPERRPDETNADDSQEHAASQPVSVKRKPGRPRKSDSQKHKHKHAGTAPAKSLKRQASVLSTISVDDQTGTSVVKDTPAPGKKTSRKSARLSQDPSEAGGSSRRIAIGVLPSPPLRAQATRTIDQEDDTVTPAKQLEEEQAAAIRNRPIAQPKSILSRLRGVLDDCKKMVFGSQEEERAFDDVLFEIRREVHEAGRRQRE